MKRLLLALFVACVPLVAFAQPGPTYYGKINSVPPTPVPLSTHAFWGNSIAAGFDATTCAAFKTPTLNPTGTCWPDLVTSYFTGTEVNLGLGGSTLVQFGGETHTSGQERYVADLLPYCTPNNYIWDEYGINDVAFHANIALPTFESTLTTIVSACIAHGLPPSHYYMISLSYTDPSYLQYPYAYSFLFSAARADVAHNLGVPWVDVWTPMANNGSTSLLTYTGGDTGLHLTNAGAIIYGRAAETTAQYLIDNTVRDRLYAVAALFNGGIPIIYNTTELDLSAPTTSGGGVKGKTIRIYSDGSINSAGVSSCGLGVVIQGSSQSLTLDCIGNAGVPGAFGAFRLWQAATCQIACVVTMAAGTATWIFPTVGYNSPPTCQATAEGAPSAGTPALYIDPPTMGQVVVHSTLGTDTRKVHLACHGNPN